MSDTDVGKPKFLGDWTISSIGGETWIDWCDEEGIGRAIAPTWVVERLLERHLRTYQREQMDANKVAP